jgi:hypothetical protein
MSESAPTSQREQRIEDPDVLIVDALHHITCCLLNETHTKREPKMYEEDIDHLWEAVHALSLAYLRPRKIV